MKVSRIVDARVEACVETACEDFNAVLNITNMKTEDEMQATELGFWGWFMV